MRDNRDRVSRTHFIDNFIVISLFLECKKMQEKDLTLPSPWQRGGYADFNKLFLHTILFYFNCICWRKEMNFAKAYFRLLTLSFFRGEGRLLHEKIVQSRPILSGVRSLINGEITAFPALCSR